MKPIIITIFAAFLGSCNSDKSSKNSVQKTPEELGFTRRVSNLGDRPPELSKEDVIAKKELAESGDIKSVNQLIYNFRTYGTTENDVIEEQHYLEKKLTLLPELPTLDVENTQTELRGVKYRLHLINEEKTQKEKGEDSPIRR